MAFKIQDEVPDTSLVRGVVMLLGSNRATHLHDYIRNYRGTDEWEWPQRHICMVKMLSCT